MNYTYENYLYIDNIKLMKENILLIKKKLLNMFCFIYSKYFFINSIKHIYFFLKIQKIVLKSTVFKNSNQIYPNTRPKKKYIQMKI